ncbi:zincin-like metallopeptidase domain-containing protein [Paracoccus sp. Z330]|uniref:Zincin-like metallopeptidase domain-containing protein n=1 Tax=Paracoccus onchidii TaxID=3017813 RepID=A0ABT4ZIW5_9RHOB|nr:zincin-like metallopeptidase domain-containing protein [Paracoccus onchidii]MDB6179308.1 zincin-like metallopeptidase domain-containing protein [Paracoccus onchidii]
MKNGRYSDAQIMAVLKQVELVAEIGACMTSLSLGLTPDFGQSGAYIEGWLKALRDDKKFIFSAASAAQKAVDYTTALANIQHRESSTPKDELGCYRERICCR